MNHSGCTFLQRGVSYTRCTAMHHSKDHFAAHILSTPFQITRWKAFYWSYSTKRAQILLLNFCTAIFYDLNSIWHQIIWFCKLLVKLITGLKAQNSSAWRWRSLGSNCEQKLHQRHICDERDFERFCVLRDCERFCVEINFERFCIERDFQTWRWRSLGSKCGAQVTSTPHLRWERFEVWIASQTTHPYFFLRLPGFSSK